MSLVDNSLIAFEKDIEENFASQISILDKDMSAKFQKAAQKHLRTKKSMTIRVSQQDIEAIKIKASRKGIAYQTYINMLIHLDAIQV